MSEQEPDAEKREWPTRCEFCETELETAKTVGLRPGIQEQLVPGEAGELVFVDFCPNPDCPSKDPGLAPAADHQDVWLPRESDVPNAR